ncbi:MAG TPA: nitronate monooxygenase [Segeticoccus sp.]|uniref:NAD(P)H-dependent flavin oxidoreductase n=1 Tax=Segeticoccus sp. TaxID=2706531 RepID=UPI002D809370|nr:nitronate monooxygenase [Segeticoccus sp.]HET8600464.1 nitronate monooxygenase [Segeticoccus sp.]
MDLFSAIDIPVLSAPMPGGPSTPELVAALASCGGSGFLGAGYGPAEKLRGQIQRTRELTPKPFGVNVFVPGAVDREATEPVLARYRQLLADEAGRWQVELPEPQWHDTTYFEDKIDLLAAEPVPVVTFTFGIPPAGVIERLQEAGSTVGVTVTDPTEAASADAAGADFLCVQAATAGGHRSTHSVAAEPNDLALVPLLQQVRPVTSLPLVGAGGVTTAADVRAALDAGATAVQVGSALLRTPESGANPAYKDALADPQREATVVSRAFTGRPARMLRNAFTDTYGPQAPAAFPMVQQVLAQLRAAATSAGDTDAQPMYAGIGHLSARDVPAAEVVRDLVP